MFTIERNSAAIVARLRPEGWQDVGKRGSHLKMRHPLLRRTVIIPHPKKDLPIGTARNIPSPLAGLNDPVLTYIAIVHQDGDSAFGITFPDLLGCFSAADREGQLMDCAQEALSLYSEDVAAMPAPRGIGELRADRGIAADLAAGAFLFAIPFQLQRSVSSGSAKSESTGSKAAAAAAKVMKDPKASKDAKTAAASAISQSKSAEVTSPKAASAAARTLNDKGASKEAKAAAASALTQRTAKKK